MNLRLLIDGVVRQTTVLIAQLSTSAGCGRRSRTWPIRCSSSWLAKLRLRASFRCELCTGADCGDIYPTASECDRAHESCYEEQGLSQSCQDDNDGVIVRRTCCGACGLNEEDMLMGISVYAEATYLDRCASAASAACVSTNDPKACTHCSEGSCIVSTMP